ncbi:MAG: hypothetical protein AAFQ96_00950 [Pseudomonadota bacterium]
MTADLEHAPVLRKFFDQDEIREFSRLAPALAGVSIVLNAALIYFLIYLALFQDVKLPLLIAAIFYMAAAPIALLQGTRPGSIFSQFSRHVARQRVLAIAVERKKWLFRLLITFDALSLALSVPGFILFRPIYTLFFFRSKMRGLSTQNYLIPVGLDQAIVLLGVATSLFFNLHMAFPAPFSEIFYWCSVAHIVLISISTIIFSKARFIEFYRSKYSAFILFFITVAMQFFAIYVCILAVIRDNFANDSRGPQELLASFLAAVIDIPSIIDLFYEYFLCLGDSACRFGISIIDASDVVQLGGTIFVLGLISNAFSVLTRQRTDEDRFEAILSATALGKFDDAKKIRDQMNAGTPLNDNAGVLISFFGEDDKALCAHARRIALKNYQDYAVDSTHRDEAALFVIIGMVLPILSANTYYHIRIFKIAGDLVPHNPLILLHASFVFAARNVDAVRAYLRAFQSFSGTNYSGNYAMKSLVHFDESTLDFRSRVAYRHSAQQRNSMYFSLLIANCLRSVLPQDQDDAVGFARLIIHDWRMFQPTRTDPLHDGIIMVAARLFMPLLSDTLETGQTEQIKAILRRIENSIRIQHEELNLPYQHVEF